MTGFATAVEESADGVGNMPHWEALAVDAVGNTIDFWRFKRNHGRIWGLLYLRDRAMTAPELQETLGLSKGAVSMLSRELEQWGVIRRVRAPHDENWRFVAEIDMRKMIQRVIEEREASFVRRVRTDLDEAERLAKEAQIPKETMTRLSRLRLMAQLVDKALSAFLQTAKLDVFSVLGIFKEKP